MADIPPDGDVPFPPPPSGGGERDERLLDLVAELGELRARVEQLSKDRDQDKQTIKELTQLGPAVEGLSEAVERSTSFGPAMSAQQEESASASWTWVTMSPGEQADRLVELARWVQDVLRARYPGRTANIRPCWPEHPTVLEELAWLYGEWWLAYLDEEGTHRHAGEWHDRWLDGVLQRFDRDKEFAACEETHKEQLAQVDEHGPNVVAVLVARRLQAQQQAYNERKREHG